MYRQWRAYRQARYWPLCASLGALVARVLLANVPSAHATAQLHPTARRLPVKAKHSVWRSAPLLSAPRQP